MPWLTRGLREGVVTSGYPRRPDGYAPSWRGAVAVRDAGQAGPEVERLCPTRAIRADGDRIRLDRGRCILCGRCVAARPDLFAFTPDFETAELSRGRLVVPDVDDSPAALDAVRTGLARRVRGLRRSVHVRHVDAGSDGTEEWEIAALTNPVYDIHRLGVFITASPRHADLLLVTGAGAKGMAGPLAETRRQMPEPVVVVAAGVDAASGGLLAGSYAVTSGVAGQLDVDVWVPGSPPSPFGLLYGILLGLGRLPRSREGAR
jgi:Ni,Fe-hydrogenase III small subunit/ferredoxin